MNGDEPAIPYQHTFTAGAGTIDAMARAAQGWSFRQRSWWACRLIFSAVFFLIFYVSQDPALPAGSRIGGSLVFAAVGSVVIHVVLQLTVKRRLVRGAHLRLHDGAVLRSGFGESEFVVSTEVSTTRMSYAAVRSIAVHDDFVFIRYHGNPLTSIYPRALFPDGERERMGSMVSRPGGRGPVTPG